MAHCGRYADLPVTRRDLLAQAAGGFGLIALAGLLDRYGCAAGPAPGALALPHHAPRAKSVIFLYMDGGPSQVDTFDPKPRLTRDHGKPFAMKMEPTQFNNNGTTLKSPWTFRNYGACGLPVSDLFPHVGRHADRLCVVRSMTSNFSEHTNANYFLHCGFGQAGRPSMGAWMSYGLGNERDDLPGFVVLNGGLTPPGGLDNFASGFLPATHQASIFGANGLPNVRPTESNDRQARKLAAARALDRDLVASTGPNDALESAIANAELAYRMQTAVPDLLDLAGESKRTRALYGLDAEYAPTRQYGRQCLLARRLVERGVRFVELTCPRIGGPDRWDQHANLREHHAANALAVDQPIGGLLQDLAQRGLLEETLVVWAAEFGRTPFAQGTDGRDHNPFGYTIWMAGGGVQGGTTWGATDEFGYKAVDGAMTIHDLHATMLHVLGIDHERLTVEFGGRAMRLTDVHGHVNHALLG